MNVSSDKNKVLEKLTLKQMQALLSIIDEATLKRIDFIEKRYKDRSHNFSETLDFLTNIGWVCADGDELSLTKSASEFTQAFSDATDLANRILGAITITPNEYTGLFAGYLSGFTVVANEVESRPS